MGEVFRVQLKFLSDSLMLCYPNKLNDNCIIQVLSLGSMIKLKEYRFFKQAIHLVCSR